MASGSIGSCERLVQQVLRYVPVRDLFSCSEVNDLWHRLSLALLLIKLKWVLCVAARKDRDETWCLRNYCAQLRRLSEIAREAGKKATLNLLLISTTRDDERSVLNGAHQSLPQDCGTVLFKSKHGRTLNFVECSKGLNGVLVFDSLLRKPWSTLRNVSNTIVVVFQREPMDTFVMQHIRCVCSDVAVISMSGEVVDEVRSIASDGTSTPSDHGRVAIMVLRLLPAHTDKKANKNKSKFRTPASV